MTDPQQSTSPIDSVTPRDAFESVPVPATHATAESAAREREADEVDLRDREFFFNRELSWLDFNERVLELAEQQDQPLLERVKFTAIFSSNLDEFVMIRVAGIHDLIDAGIEKRGPDGRDPDETVDGDPRTHRRSARTPVARAARRAAARRWPRTASRSVRVDGARRRAARRTATRVSGPDLPGADAAGGRPGSTVPVHLEPLAEPRRAAARPAARPDHLRPRQGAEGDPAALRRRSSPTASWSRSRT